MFVYQNDKLYVETDDILVGVDITPTGAISTNEISYYIDGLRLTFDEVVSKFGMAYKFPILKTKG